MFESSKNEDDLCFLPVSSLSQLITSGEISSMEVTNAYLSRIAKLDLNLNSYVEVFEQKARLAAGGFDREARKSGLAFGVPIALKDLFELEGEITTAGSAHYRERRSEVTGSLAKRLIGSGAVILGKTHTTEFAYSGWGVNPHMGTPWNPWDEDTHRIPGGSSSGSAVAVSAGLAPWAIGTDTGGSVRLPSAFCGVTGLKTTAGQLATDGIVPLSRTFDTPGPIARSVLDAAMLYNVMLGPSSPFAFGSNTVSGITRELEGGVRGLKFAAMPAEERIDVQADLLEAYDRSLNTFRRLGAEIVEIKLPFRFKDCFGPHMTIVNAEAYFNLQSVIDDQTAVLDDSVRLGVAAGRKILLPEYLEAFAEIERLKAALSEALLGVDALLVPTTEFAALAVEGLDRSNPPSRFTRFVNTLGMCALTLPNGITSSGLPISFQIVGREHQERLALRSGFDFQRSTDWHLRRSADFLGPSLKR